MKIIYAILTIFIAVNLSGCKNYNEMNNAHNEIYGVFASLEGDVYYIEKNVLYKYNGERSIKVYDNVISVQKNNDTIYCICTENHQSYSLFRNIGDEFEKLFDLDNGTYQQSMVYNDKLYCCINNKITVYNLQTGENTLLETEVPVTRFCVYNNRVCYWSIKILDLSFDDYIDAIKSGDELDIFEGELYLFDLYSSESQKLFHTYAKEDIFFLSPTRRGVVFFAPTENELNIYDGKKVKPLVHGYISSMITDNDYVYYSMNDNRIYKTDVGTGNMKIFADNINTIYGLDNTYLFDGDSFVIEEIQR